MQEYVTDLRKSIEDAAPLLLAISDEVSATPIETDAWCPRQIIGHLIDSAANNHRRFVTGQFQDDLVFSGYDGEKWVDAQEYKSADWRELVELWKAYNLHLSRVMSLAPDAVRLQPREKHNLDEIASRAVPVDQSTTLDYLMEDYVFHLKHHLRQILGTDWGK
jgi:hypothetical protein